MIRSGFRLKIPANFKSGTGVARIIVIDDDHDVRALMVWDLQAAGHEVRAATDGAHGLSLQRASPADLVVTDIYMPEKEGIETIRELKEQYPTLKIIAVSGGGSYGSRKGFSTRELSVVAAELGVAAVLQKPFASAELLRTVDAALAKH